MQALVQRLSLLAAIELPCAVQLSQLDHDQGSLGRIRSCGSTGGCFRLSGENFSLQLSEATIDTVRLTEQPAGGRPDTCIEILAANGHVMARIKGAPDHSNAAVWQDIMDTFDCA
ncbi:MAG: hypothetical protein FJ189_08805 [Gammaproteobacteria bacterium]|nr:hypothetical protein [Gammaproteobacteria bacterium]